jgi:hypothetical protein
MYTIEIVLYKVYNISVNGTKIILNYLKIHHILFNINMV